MRLICRFCLICLPDDVPVYDWRYCVYCHVNREQEGGQVHRTVRTVLPFLGLRDPRKRRGARRDRAREGACRTLSQIH